MKVYKIVLNVFIAFNLIACSDSVPTEPYPYTELAMEPGMAIEATNKNGTVTIEYLSPLERRYKWGRYDEIRTLIPRKKRFYGELGAYDPASAFVWEDGPRIVATDSQLYFKNMKEVKAELYQGSAVMDWVYTDYGIVIGFSTSPSRKQVNIDVYQYFINGKKPTKLAGSRSENIKITKKSQPIPRPRPRNSSGEEIITFALKDPKAVKSALRIFKEENIRFNLNSNGRYEFLVSDLPKIKKIYYGVVNNVSPYGNIATYNPEMQKLMIKTLNEHKTPYVIHYEQGVQWITWKESEHEKVKGAEKIVKRLLMGK